MRHLPPVEGDQGATGHTTPADGQKITVGQLTPEHVGWLIEVHRPEPGSMGLVHPSRTFVLGRGIRRWDDTKGIPHVGLLDTSDAAGRCLGTEREYPPDTPVTLVRPVKRRRRR